MSVTNTDAPPTGAAITPDQQIDILEHIHDRVTRLLRRWERLPDELRPADPAAAEIR